MKWYFIELPKFRKAKVNMEDRVNQWLAFIDDFKGEKSKMAEKKNEIIRKAKKEMNYLTGEAAERRMQELRERWEMDYNSDIGEAKEQGKTEEKEKIVINMLNMKMDIEKIKEATGISEEEINKIKNKKL